MILSDKSSGSSILQAVLAAHPRIKILEPGHFHCESRYWMYGAALIDPAGQPAMRYSHEFPVTKKEAIHRLNRVMELIGRDGFFHMNSQENDLYRGWALLCQAQGPVFLEKSPHHLHSRMALEMIMKFKKQNPGIRMRFIGLIRNPVATLYSMYRRWHAIPEKRQFEWLRAYRNLEWTASRTGPDLLRVRFEDLIGDPAFLVKIFKFCGVADRGGFEQFSQHPVQRWKNDRWWGFTLAPVVKGLASRYYAPEDLVPVHPARRWFLMRTMKIPGYRLLRGKRMFKQFLKRLTRKKGFSDDRSG
jgi:hypothetical protein